MRNVIAVRSQISGSYETTLIVKLAVVAVSQVTALQPVRAAPLDSQCSAR